MKNKIILNLAASLDGYIADENGGFDWIRGSGKNDLDTKEVWSHNKFLESVSAVIMGKKSFDQNLHNEYKNKQIYVASAQKLADHDNIHFSGGDDLLKTVSELKEKGEGDIYIFGGGVLADTFIKSGMTDEFIIGIIPVILGKGIPLFLDNNPSIPLNLTHYYIENDIVILRYAPR